MSVIREINCSHCGGPIQFNPGEIVATCRYCGFTQVIEAGKPFIFEHSMFLNEYFEGSGIQREPSGWVKSDKERRSDRRNDVESVIRTWMKTGFTKPGSLGRDANIIEKTLMYVPFWVFPVEATSLFKGVFERIAPAIVKDGRIEKLYDWLVLARKGAWFPTREYDVPLKAKVPYDFRRIESFAKVLNSEVDEAEAIAKAEKEIEGLHRFLAKEDVDKIIDWDTDFKFGETVYLHAPIWFIAYEYKKKRYSIILDGATGTVIKGDIPAPEFGLV